MDSKRVRVGPIGLAVAERISSRRRELSLTQGQVSSAVEELTEARISSAALGEIEKGMRRVDVDDLAALARALGTNVNYLIYGGHSDLSSLLADDAEPYDRQVDAALALASGVEDLVIEYRERVRGDG